MREQATNYAKHKQMADNFNLTGFLKKNQLLNENIGGYRDIQPVKEEISTAMGENDVDPETEIPFMDYEDTLENRLDGMVNRGDLAKFRQAILDIAATLDDQEVEIDEVKEYIMSKLEKTLTGS